MTEYCFEGIRCEVSIPATVDYACEQEGMRKKHTFTAEWNRSDIGTEAPVLHLSWSKPIEGMLYQWNSACRFDRTIRPDFCGPTSWKISSGCPLRVFYDDADISHYAIALDDCVSCVESRAGVHEENANLVCDVWIPLDRTGNTLCYRVVLWEDETPVRYEEAIRKVIAWWEQKYPPMDVPEAARETLYSCWYSLHQQVFEEEVEKQASLASKMGMKSIIVDDGWQTDDNQRGYAYCGDWQVTPGKIRDMRAHVERIHALGLKYILWYSVPFIGIHSEAAKMYSELTLYRIDRLGAYVLDPRYPQVREYLIGIYVKALKEWNLDGFKLDFIDSFRMTEESPAFREGMDYVVLEEAVQRLMIDVMKALRAIKPDILIEFRQSYIGPVMRMYGNMFRVGDCPADINSNRVGMVDLRLTGGESAVHSDMLVWNSRESMPNAAAQIENVLFATVQFSVCLDQVPPEHVRAIRFWTRFMAEERELLLKTPIHAESPQLLYPLVSAEKDGRGIIACYAKNHLVRIGTDLREAIVVNANAGSGVLLEAGGIWKIEKLEPDGQYAGAEEVDFADGSFRRVSCVPYGLLKMKKVR